MQWGIPTLFLDAPVLLSALGLPPAALVDSFGRSTIGLARTRPAQHLAQHFGPVAGSAAAAASAPTVATAQAQGLGGLVRAGSDAYAQAAAQQDPQSGSRTDEGGSAQGAQQQAGAPGQSVAMLQYAYQWLHVARSSENGSGGSSAGASLDGSCVSSQLPSTAASVCSPALSQVVQQSMAALRPDLAAVLNALRNRKAKGHDASQSGASESGTGASGTDGSSSPGSYYRLQRAPRSWTSPAWWAEMVQYEEDQQKKDAERHMVGERAAYLYNLAEVTRERRQSV